MLPKGCETMGRPKAARLKSEGGSFEGFFLPYEGKKKPYEGKSKPFGAAKPYDPVRSDRDQQVSDPNISFRSGPRPDGKSAGKPYAGVKPGFGKPHADKGDRPAGKPFGAGKPFKAKKPR